MKPDQITQWTWRKTVLHGGELGAVLAVAYALLFDTYAIASSSIGDTPQAISANAVSIFTQTIPWTVVTLVAAGLVGALTAALIKAALARLNPSGLPGRGMLLGFGITIVLVVLLTLVLVVAGTPMTLDVYPGTYLFWVGLPALFYVAAGAVGAERISAA